MKRHDLSGAWQVRAASRRKSFPATVPGCIHADLLAAGRIAPPGYRDNARKLLWIGRETWIYSREFTLDDFATLPVVRLRCDGLDTFATLTLNDIEIGRADNMHRSWDFDVRKVLRPGPNVIEVRFDPPPSCPGRRVARRRPADGKALAGTAAGRSWPCRMACGCGREGGLLLSTCGIWRGLAIEGYETARLEDVHIRQRHDSAGGVALELAVAAERFDSAAGLEAVARVAHKGVLVNEGRVVLDGAGRARLLLEVPNAQLWWPNGFGEQPLYEVGVELRGGTGRRPLDSAVRRVGLRTLRLDRRPDEWGENFAFAVNGAPFFVKGANWIPADALVARLTRVEYARLVKAAAVANMNMLRVRGGGVYEQDCFYDLCDEYGICVWQDFMFPGAASSTAGDAWLDGARAGAEQNIRRLRHHPCLALWGGGASPGSHDGGGGDGPRLFDRLLAESVARLDPERDCRSGDAPASPAGCRREGGDPFCGDACLPGLVLPAGGSFGGHAPGHGRLCSEFGFPSFPEPRAVAAFTAPADRRLDSPVMAGHQCAPGDGTCPAARLSAWFREPAGFDNTLWLSQIRQGLAMKHAVEHWRRSRPRCMGTLYWRLNDCWPAASCSSVDSDGRWKAAHYMARRFYAPLLISAVADEAAGTVEVHLGNDLRQPFAGTVKWRVRRADGTLLREQERAARLEPNSAVCLGVLRMPGLLRAVGARKLMVWLSLEDGDGRVVSSNLALFRPRREIELDDPCLGVAIGRWDECSYAVTLTARRPALCCWMEIEGCEARCEDNFFDLEPGRPQRFRVLPAVRLGPEEFRRSLRVRSLRDIWQEE